MTAPAPPTPKRRNNPPTSPWRNGPERLPDGTPARNTVSRKLRLTPEEDTALVRVAAARGITKLNRAAGALFLEEAGRLDATRSKAMNKANWSVTVTTETGEEIVLWIPAWAASSHSGAARVAARSLGYKAAEGTRGIAPVAIDTERA